MSWKKAILLLAIVVLAAGCRRSQSQGRYRIALVTKALDSEFWQRMKEGAEAAAAKDPDVELTVQAPQREINIDQQVTILEDLILRRVSVLAVAPAGVSEVVPVLNKAKAAGIPVLLVDTDAPWPSKRSFIGTDNRQGGRLAGEFIKKSLGGKGKVAVIRGILGVSSQEDRFSGFEEALSQVPGIKLVTVQPANSERPLGMAVMENILTSTPDVNAVFAGNDEMALGAMEAIAAHGLTGKIVLVGFDAGQEAVRAIKTGRMTAAVAQHSYEIGRMAISAAIKVARGQTVDNRIETPTTIVTRENAGQFLLGR